MFARRFFSSGMGIIVLGLLMAGGAGAATTISIASQTVSSGGNVTVPIIANNITNVSAYSVSLTYNKAIVIVDSVKAADLGVPSSTINNATGVTKMWIFTRNSLSGNVTLANVVLRAVGTSGTSALTITVTALSNDTGLPILTGVSSGTFIIAPGTTISIASQTVSPGGNVTVPIIANNITNLGAYTVSLTYNPAVVVVDSVVAVNFDAASSINNITGVTVISGYNTTPQTGNITLANVNLRAVGSIEQTSQLNLGVTTLINEAPTTISALINNGSFGIARLAITATRPNRTGTVIPTTNISTNISTYVIFTVTEGPNSVSGATVNVTQNGSPVATGDDTDILGQVNLTVTAPTNDTVNVTASMVGYTNGTTVLEAKGDLIGEGNVTINDALLIAQYTVGSKTLTPTQLILGDVKGTGGKPTIADALLIAQYTVDLIPDPTTP
ncbi:MAG: hypothetical protein O8C61_00185 [Candidatus Methanoperedens sp.]|nr:hypothetical protein [Candidatus Methanoperedens sp.]